MEISINFYVVFFILLTLTLVSENLLNWMIRESRETNYTNGDEGFSIFIYLVRTILLIGAYCWLFEQIID